MASIERCAMMDGFPVATQMQALKKEYDAMYVITTDDSDWRDINAIGQAAQLGGSPDRLPVMGTAFVHEGSIDIGSFVQRIRITPDKKARKRWVAEVQWRPLPNGKRPQDLDPNVHPVNRPKREWLESVTETAQIAKGWNQIELPQAGDGFNPRPADTEGPIVNAAGESYDEALYEDDHYSIYVQQKNVESPAEAYNLQLMYGRTLNQGSFLGFPEDCAKFLSAETGEPQTETFGTNLVEFYTMTVRIALRRTPWHHDIVNRGYNEIIENRFSSEKGLHRIFVKDDRTDGKLVATPEPVLLDVNGVHLEDGILGNTIPYRTRERKSYQGLLI